MKLTMILVISLFLLSCAASINNKKPASKIVIPKTEKECIAQGGHWSALGIPMEGRQKECNPKTVDVGKICSDSSQCQGLCLAPKQINPVNYFSQIIRQATGNCSAYFYLFGNIKEIENGRISNLNID